MKTKQMVFLSGIILVGLAGFIFAADEPGRKAETKASGAVQAPTPAAQTNVTAAADFPVIGYIEKRDRTIVIKAGPKGTVYSVKTADGKVLYENLSAEQLQAQAPELREFFKSAVAGNSGKDHVTIDASLERARRVPVTQQSLPGSRIDAGLGPAKR